MVHSPDEKQTLSVSVFNTLFSLTLELCQEVFLPSPEKKATPSNGMASEYYVIAALQKMIT